MRRVVCAGCGKSEPEGENKIRPVMITLLGDQRVRYWEQEESHAEELCSDCIKGVLRTYFNVNISDVVPPIAIRAVS